MHYGTHHFVTLNAAIDYYHKQGFQPRHVAKAAVTAKLAAGEIELGPPPLKEGQTYFLIDDNTRYAIKE